MVLQRKRFWALLLLLVFVLGAFWTYFRHNGPDLSTFPLAISPRPDPTCPEGFPRDWVRDKGDADCAECSTLQLARDVRCHFLVVVDDENDKSSRTSRSSASPLCFSLSFQFACWYLPENPALTIATMYRSEETTLRQITLPSKQKYAKLRMWRARLSGVKSDCRFAIIFNTYIWPIFDTQSSHSTLVHTLLTPSSPSLPTDNYRLVELNYDAVAERDPVSASCRACTKVQHRSLSVIPPLIPFFLRCQDGLLLKTPIVCRFSSFLFRFWP